MVELFMACQCLLMLMNVKTSPLLLHLETKPTMLRHGTTGTRVKPWQGGARRNERHIPQHPLHSMCPTTQFGVAAESASRVGLVQYYISVMYMYTMDTLHSCLHSNYLDKPLVNR